MTAIAAKFSKDGKKIIFGSDSQTSWGTKKYNNTETSGERGKMLKIDDKFCIAGAGSCRETHLFQRYCLRCKPAVSSEDGIFDFMNEFHTWVMKRDSGFEWSSQYIIFFEGKLFTVIRGWEVREHSKHAAMGSGFECIHVAFSMGADIKEAIGMAIKYNKGCGGEVNLISIDI